MRLRWVDVEQNEVRIEEMLNDPNNFVYDDQGNAIDANQDAIYDSLAYRIRQVEFMHTGALFPGEPSAPGLTSHEDIVWFDIGEDRWSVASRLTRTTTFDYEHDDGDTQQLTSQWSMITPIFYTRDAGSAALHARFVWGDGDLDAALGTGGEPTSTNHKVLVSAGSECDRVSRRDRREADRQYQRAKQACVGAVAASAGSVLDRALDACIGFAAICALGGGAFPGAGVCCAVAGATGAIVAGMVVGVQYRVCLRSAALDRFTELDRIFDDYLDCCNGVEGCGLSSND
jgi:hypothetical protein